MAGLIKPKSYAWCDTNVALLGTDKDHAVKSKSSPGSSTVLRSAFMNCYSHT